MKFPSLIITITLLQPAYSSELEDLIERRALLLLDLQCIDDQIDNIIENITLITQDNYNTMVIAGE